MMLYGVAHRLWRVLPRSQRQALFYALTGALAPRPDPAPPGGSPVTVAGLLSATTGLGEGARLCLNAVRSLGIPTRAIDLAAVFDQSDMPGGFPDAPPPAPDEGGTMIVHVNGPYLPFALWRMGRAAVRGRRIVGYWYWELPAVPPSWRRGLPFVHEIWAPSRFTADAIATLTDRPIRLVPIPLAPPHPAPIGRADFGLPDDAFVAMSFFHMGSSFNRKNPLGAVAAFRSAFGDDPRALLVLKVVDDGAAPAQRRRLDEAIQGAANIRLIERRLTRDEVTALLAVSDVVLSLHRSEGFGLVPAQAMQLGKPVIATGWSANLDFMDRESSILLDYRLISAEDPQGTYDLAGQKWADPDVEQAAAALRSLAADPELRERIGDLARRKAEIAFAPDAYREALGLR